MSASGRVLHLSPLAAARSIAIPPCRAYDAIRVQEQSLAGTSSFGMSGVNAHALLEAPSEQSQADAADGLAWRRERTWPAPPRMALLAACAPSTMAGSATVTIVADLVSPRLAYLHDHQVSGRSWLRHVTCGATLHLDPGIAGRTIRSAGS